MTLSVDTTIRSASQLSVEVADELVPLVEYFARRFQCEQPFRELALRDIRADLPRRLEQLLTSSRCWGAPVRVVRIATVNDSDATDRLLARAWCEGLAVVDFGRARPSLRDRFLHALNERVDQQLVGYGGFTPQHPVASAAVTIHDELARKVGRALISLDVRREEPYPSGTPRARGENERIRRQQGLAASIRRVFGAPRRSNG